MDIYKQMNKGGSVPKKLVVTNGLNPYVRHYRVITAPKTQLIRGKEVPLRTDVRLQSLVTPLLMNRDITDTHAKNGDLTVHVKTIESWRTVDQVVIDSIYNLLEISIDDRRKVPITRV